MRKKPPFRIGLLTAVAAMLRGRALLGFAAAFAVMLCGTIAISPAQATSDPLIEVLIRKGVLTPGEAMQIEKEARDLEKTREQQVDQKVKASEQKVVDQVDKKLTSVEKKVAAKPAPKDSWKVHWKNGLKIESPDGRNKFGLGGRIYADFSSISSSNRRFADQVRQDEGTPLTGFGSEFRAARIYVDGTVYDNYFFKGEYDFAAEGNGTAGFKDVFIGMKNIPGIGHIRVGHQKEPFSLEEQTSSRFITFMERGLPNVFAPSRNTGIMAYNTAFGKRMYWGVGIFQDVDDFGNNFNNHQDWNTTLRLAGTPLYEDKGRHLLHVGLSYSHQFRSSNDFQLRYRQRPEAHITDARTVDMFINRLWTDNIDLVNPELALVWGPFSLQGEYMFAFTEASRRQSPAQNLFLNASDPTFQGAYIFGSVFLTGESRNYSQSGACFDRITPHRNFDLKGGWGAWELGARYSYLSLSDKGVGGGRENNFTAGLNWYLTPNTRWMFNYVYADVDGRLVTPRPPTYPQDIVNGTAHVAQTRFQIDF